MTMLVFPFDKTMNSTSDCQPVIQQLQALFLKISVVDDANGDDTDNKTPFDKVLEAIKTVSQCDICSIWGITIVPSGKENESKKYVSLVARDYGEHESRVSRSKELFKNQNDFVHELKEGDDSFTRRILLDTQNGSVKGYHTLDDNFVNKSNESLEPLLEKGYVSIGIPIPCHCWIEKPKGTWKCLKEQCKNAKCTEFGQFDRFHGTNVTPGQCVDLIVKMYFKKESSSSLIEHIITNTDLITKFTTVIRDYVAQLHYQYTETRKQSLLRDLMNAFEEGGKSGKDLKVIFRNVMQTTLRKPYFHYHYATLFVWNPFDYSYHFFATTAPKIWQEIGRHKSIVVFEKNSLNETKNGSKIKYKESGRGFTSLCLRTKIISIYGDTGGIRGNHSGISCEYDPHDDVQEKRFAKTMMFVPIMHLGDERPVALLRFMNKKNLALVQQSKGVEDDPQDYYDCFDNFDKNIVSSIVPYLALLLKNYQSDKKQKSVIDLMAHEVGTPASSARDDIRWLLSEYKPPPDYYRHRLLRTIADNIEILAFNAELHKLLSNFESGKPRTTRYNTDESTEIAKNYLVEIISRARDIAKSLVREVDGNRGKIKFENIRIFQDWDQYDRGIKFDRLDFEHSHFAIDNLKYLKKPFRDRAIYLANNPVRAVFVNLLFNAIKYRDLDKGREFQVDIVIRYNPDKTVIEISDYGRGIDRDDVEDIFLYGVRGKRGDDASGCGLGLYLARKIIEDFFGNIRVTQRENPTTFSITFPDKLFDSDYTKIW